MRNVSVVVVLEGKEQPYTPSGLHSSYLNPRYLGPWEACPSCFSQWFHQDIDPGYRLQFVVWYLKAMPKHQAQAFCLK